MFSSLLLVVLMHGAPPAPSALIPLKLRQTDARWILRREQGQGEVALSGEAPLFDFGEVKLGGPSAGPGQWTRQGHGQAVTWTGAWRVGGEHGGRIRAILSLDPTTGLAHKTAEIELLSGSPLLLRSVLVDEVNAEGLDLSHRSDWQNRPVFSDLFFFALEFPVATTHVEGQKIFLSHAPGRMLSVGQTFRSRTAVYAGCRSGEVRTAFEAYLAGIGQPAQGLHFNYNSWWTSPVPYTEPDILKIVQDFRGQLFDPYKVAPDTFCIDMGWAKNTTLWQIDSSLFPNGFSGLNEAAQSIDSHLGLWISPSGVYPQALDLKWAKGAGYEADTKACLAGPKYQEALESSLSQKIRDFGIQQVKLDGYVPSCDATDHGHEPGPLSIEPMAEGILDVMEAVHQADPHAWIEPTCFGFDPSPWWLVHADSVIGAFGDDSPCGRVPCPIYRESYTSARDYFNLKGATHIQLPIVRQEVLGIIHQTEEPLQNDAIMTVLRGHAFLSLYINPATMSPRRWEFLACLMKWARQNQDLLTQTRPILPESWKAKVPGVWEETPAPREPYGYVHWNGQEGLLCVRNPWIEEARMTLRLFEDLGLQLGPRGVEVREIYPEGSSQGHAWTGPSLSLPLAPYETALYAIRKAGKRRNTDGNTAGTKAMTRPTVDLQVKACRFRCETPGPTFGPDTTQLLPSGQELMRLRLSGVAEVPQDASKLHELWFLVEGESPVQDPYMSLSLNGKPSELKRISSEAGWKATGAPPPERWLWLTTPLSQGPCELQGEMILSQASERVSGWVVQMDERSWQPLDRVTGDSLPGPERPFTASVRAFGPIQRSDDMILETGEGPVERIQGVYLDALDPVLAEQGYGTLQRNQSVWEKPMTVGGRGFRRGLGTHAPSRILYKLAGRYTRFQAWAGPDQATGPTITMEVLADGKSLWRSGLLTRTSPAQRVDVDVSGAQELELRVGDGGNDLMADHADWADAILK